MTKIYPDWEENSNQLFEEENQVEISLEDLSSLHSTVDLDDRNNCNLSVQNLKKKHVMLDTYAQDLSSSYRDTQDSDTEDDQSTSDQNGRASDQNVFISMSESDSENSDIAIESQKRKRKR